MILLLQGPPGSGKTYIGKRLSSELGILHVSKDDLKETFFDALGNEEAETSKKLGMLSNKLLFKLIEKVPGNNSHIIIESNFDPELGKVELINALGDKEITIVEIFLTASNEVLKKRFKERWESGERHRGHVDDKRYADLEEYLSTKPRPLSFAKEIIEVDTEDKKEIIYQKVLKEVKNYLP
ncbi:MAG: AAA family ATPase [Halobacteriovoraceae bacterium]|jgi:adenylate kinase family enzyme|nr:AAA family ATPase [Halobacteriovoraceae bacterium]MBT5093823.1 AAA family ATPase [Halobacteriovoraceae bacterium]